MHTTQGPSNFCFLSVVEIHVAAAENTLEAKVVHQSGLRKWMTKKQTCFQM